MLVEVDTQTVKEGVYMLNIFFCALALLVASTELSSACIMSEEYKRDYFAKRDLDKNGQISFEEFLASNQGTGTYGKSEEFKQRQHDFFSKLDHDHSGQLSYEEYNSVSHVRCR